MSQFLDRSGASTPLLESEPGYSEASPQATGPQPGLQPDISGRLLGYLANRLGVHGLDYSHEPKPVRDGWETYIFHFQLDPSSGLPTAFRGPLTIRLLPGPQTLPRGQHAFAVQQHLNKLGYPVPAPLIWEEDSEVLGGPFLIMEQVPGATMLHKLVSEPWNSVGHIRSMAELHTKLHGLPTSGFPDQGQPLLERCLEEIQERMGQYGLNALSAGLAWLRDHTPEIPSKPCIVHLDFHPLNLIYRADQLPVVLDWDEADIGDYHADIATTLMLMHCAPHVGKDALDQFTITAGKWIVGKLYLFACRRRCDLDLEKLRWYQAWATLRRLARYGMCLADSPSSLGVKPSLCRHLQLDHLEDLRRYFHRLTGIRILLDSPPWNLWPIS